MTNPRVLLLTAVLGIALPLHPAQKPATTVMLTLDPARTQVRFTISDALHTIHGTFVMRSGEVQYDPATGTARGDIAINATSGDSGNHTRDSRMKKSILQVAQFPEVHFLPRHILGTVPQQGTGHFQVQGLCRLHGSEHPLILDFAGTVSGTRFSGTTHFAIPYVQWGLKDPSTWLLRVSKQVAIDITTTGTLSRPRT